MSTDIINIAKLFIFFLYVYCNITTKEELLTVIPMKGQTRDEDVYNSFKGFITKIGFPIHKLVSITIDGTPVIVGNQTDFITLCMDDDNTRMLNFTSYHCSYISKFCILMYFVPMM